ncbi:MAG: hypothetical protein L0H36_02555 [bacterium]|nr:hypothetical protein [bacterium]
MNSNLLTIRAVGAELANRLWRRVLILAIIISALLIGLVILLETTVSVWWLLLGFPVIIAVSVALGILFISKQIIRTVSPVKSTEQRQATKQFVDKLQSVSEVFGTPKFMILYNVIRDIAAPRKDGYVATMINNSTSLTSDFKQLSKLF